MLAQSLRLDPTTGGHGADTKLGDAWSKGYSRAPLVSEHSTALYMKYAFLALFFIQSFVCTNAAHAQRIDHAGLGQKKFAAGEYREALEHFQRGYEMNGAPILLYNIGQSADRLRLDATTLRAFQMYLQRYPDAPNREEVEHRIQILTPLVANQTQALQAERVAQLDQPPSKSKSKLRASEGENTVTVNVSETLLPSPYQRKPEPLASPDVLHNPWFWVASAAVFVALVCTVALVASEGPSSAESSSSAGASPSLLVIRH